MRTQTSKRHIFVRNTNAPELIEMFLVASAASVLGIRAFLALANYPQVSGGGLHIAHMLWGGLFMLLALLLLFSSLGQVMLRLSAILGGIGFGTFIDELGKFITSDNNYFFSPTIGLIYIIFISIFLVMRVLARRQSVNHNVALANALNRLELVGGGALDRSKRQEILALLENADPRSPLAQTLRAYIDEAAASQTDDPGLYMRSREWLLSAYERIALNRYFIIGVVLALVALSIGQVVQILVLLIQQWILGQDLEITFSGGARLASATAASALTLFGAWRLRVSRLSAYLWFQRGALVGIFITQMFAFFEMQLAAITGLFIEILIYAALSFMIEFEQRAQIEADGE